MCIKKLCISVALAMACGTVAQAQQWQPQGPDGGQVRALVRGYAGTGQVFALANNGLFVSDDAGQQWRGIGIGLNTVPYQSQSALAASPLAPARLFLFDGDNRLMRSEDSGESWTATGYVHPQFDSIVGMGISAAGLLISPSSGGVFLSTDLGATFVPTQGVDFSQEQPMGVLAVNPSAPLEVFAGVFLGPVFDGYPSLFRSVDGGVNWVPVLHSELPVDIANVEFLTASDIVTSLGGEVYRSTDAGVSWTSIANFLLADAHVARVSPGSNELLLTDGRDCYRSADFFVTAAQACTAGLPQWGGGNTDFESLIGATDAAGKHHVLATARRYGVIALDDTSYVWSPRNRLLQAETSHGLAIAPTDPQWYLSGQSRTDSFGLPLLSSRDGGASWQRDLGDKARLIRTVAFDPTRSADAATAVLYAAGVSRRLPAGQTNSGIYKSTDGGANWTALNDNLPSFSQGGISGVLLDVVDQLKLDPRSCALPPARGACTQGPLDTVFALSKGSGQDGDFRVIRSTQGGAQWSAVGAGLPARIEADEFIQSVHPVDLEFDAAGQTLYLALVGNYLQFGDTPQAPGIVSGVFASTDGGSTWTARNSGLPLFTGSSTTTRDVPALAVHPRRSGVLWAALGEPGLSSSIYRSSDGGLSWTQAGALPPGCAVHDLQVDAAAPQVLYAAGTALQQQRGCLLRSEDSGDSWTALHAQLPVAAVNDVRQQPGNPRRLVVSSERGIWTADAPGDRIFNTGLDEG
ncbi:hypothetical protein DFR29_11356 [Tahibacter aquaticus]|uniref:Sortilin (Neurotensin receptor 3) n=1 Tax=Tahibacter aquaticus TaxID=520092 RepID=A0A4V3DLM9_9GAMM|nr:sialidase family protein [Tahibacter aquaticus]TDR40356.1 hypothetical protein DFR29_11356 [Tahibacter aquaticus]